MRHWVRFALFAALVAVPLSSASPGRSAAPSGGSISATSPQVTWRGGPFPVSTVGAGCPLGSLDPVCDHYALTIDPVAGKDVEVHIAADTEGDIPILSVYAPDGRQVATSSELTRTKSVVVHAPVAGTYEVRVEPGVALNGGGTYGGRASFVDATDPIDFENHDCIEATPAAVSPAPLLGASPLHADDGREIFVDIAVLLDTAKGGVSQADAAAAFEIVNRPYNPYGITVRASSYDFVDYSGITGSPDLIQAAKDHFGGTRPAGADLVLVLTAQDIQALGQTAVAGQADCLGGVRYDSRAFMVGEAWDADGVPIGPFTFIKYGAAKVIAHEMGHLFGAQHHYANCAEGVDPETEVEDTGPCTLMYNSADFLSLEFSALNGAVVRGHAWEYARP